MSEIKYSTPDRISDGLDSLNIEEKMISSLRTQYQTLSPDEMQRVKDSRQNH